MQASNKNKHTSGTPRSGRRSSSGPDTRTPSERDLRALRREQRLIEGAHFEKYATLHHYSCSEVASIVEEEKFVDLPAQGSPAHQSQSDLKPGKPHNAGPVSSESPQQPSPLGDGLQSDPNLNHLHLHNSRLSNLSDTDHQQWQRIKFPPSKDPVWKAINAELSCALPQVFTPSLIQTTSTSDLAKKFDLWLHHFFLEKFGEAPDKAKAPPTPPKLFHRKLFALRKMKKECRAARKALVRAGLTESREYLLLTQRWFALVRQHSRLRRAVYERHDKKAKARAERLFKNNPHQFAAQLFKDSGPRGSPTFSSEEAMDYFSKTYRDEERSHCYSPLDGMQRPEVPKVLFSGRCPTRKELKKSARRKSNKACPGLNALPYVPYKKCPAILDTLHRIVIKIWKSKEVPDSWAVAFIVLLSKSDVFDKVAEFRPIAITSTVGKIFFSVLARRLELFLVKNDYIPRSIQKGFLSGMPGCVEHSFALMEALRDATEGKRQIVITWIDLANAYGSVRHNLIQFALNWYHVPADIQKLVFDYYEKLMAKVVTQEWSTGFFLFDIGLFQGCVLSTILFNCVFQLLLDFLRPYQSLGYSHKVVDVTSLQKAYADDLSLITTNSQDNQLVCDETNKWLHWTVTMAAKPKKCVSLGFRQFDPRSEASSFTPYSATKYTAFDPQLTIDGHPIRFIAKLNPQDFEDTHFKFLGRWFEVLLRNDRIEDRTRQLFSDDMEAVRKSKVNGLMKLWLYQFYILAHLSWPFMVQDFSRSFAVSLEKSTRVQLKKWAGIYKSADVGLLFRSRKAFGLGLTSITSHFETMQIIKWSLAKHSVDADIRALYAHREAKNAGLKTVWRATNLLRSLEQEVHLRQLFPTQDGRQGLGKGNFNSQPTIAERRKLAVTALRDRSDQRSLAHTVTLAMQSVWLSWKENTNPFDLSWRNLIWGPGPHVIKFVLNASINCLRTPDMLKLWGYTQTAFCPLCGHPQCTTHHVLVNCNTALVEGRYTWRHDSGLYTAQPVLQDLVSEANLRPRKPQSVPHISRSFIQFGSPDFTRAPSRSATLLDGANDWKLLLDFTANPIVFPPEVYSTTERPDIIIWSIQLRKIIMIELTCPAEEGMEAASLRKRGRYEGLVQNIRSQNTRSPWTPILMTIELGARGYVAHSTRNCFRRLGLSGSKTSRLCKALSQVMARCSLTIYLAQKSKHWDKKRALLDDGQLPTPAVKPSVVPP